MSEDNGTPRRIKVVDRRWFTDGGELRDDRPAPAAADPRPAPSAAAPDPSPAPAPAPAASPAPAAEEGQGSGRATSQVFVELVAMLAQQAELLLVGDRGFPRQPEQARRLIDYLGALESKTRGNLSAEEKQLLGNVIYQLRTLYLQAGR